MAWFRMEMKDREGETRWREEKYLEKRSWMKGNLGIKGKETFQTGFEWV